MTHKAFTPSLKSSSYKDRIVYLVERLNYHNNTFARIPLTNLSDVAKTASIIISSILGYKTIAIFFKNRDARLELLAMRNNRCAGDESSDIENRIVDKIWKDLDGPQILDAGQLVSDKEEGKIFPGLKQHVLAIPIIGVSEPVEKCVGMILVSDPPDNYEIRADMTVLEIITGLVSGAFANCLSLKSLKKKNIEVQDQKKDLKKSLDELETAHDRTLTILESIGAVVYIIDIETLKVLYINKQGQDVYGDVTGEICWQVLHQGMNGPCDFCPNHRLVHDKSLSGKTFAWEYFNPVTHRWLSMHDRLLRWVDGSLVKIQISVDITELKQQETDLKRLRNDLSNIIDAMPSMLIGVDDTLKVTQWNKRAESITGVSFDEARGQSLSTVSPFLAAHTDTITLSIKSRKTKQTQKIPHLLNDQMHYADLTVYPVMSQSGKGAVIRVDDITERIRMEEIMVQSEKMLSVGGLAAGMAHEINNPLAGMMQNAQVMKSRLKSTDMPGNLETAEELGLSMEKIITFIEKRDIFHMIDAIHEAGSRAANIVHSMLNFARKTEASFSSHYPDQLMDRILELAATDYDLKKQFDFRSIEIIKQYDDNLPMLPCEGAKIQQVMLNLLRNGAHAMQEAKTKSPVFILRIYSEDASEMVCIEIEDNGPGMDTETRSRVFDPFFTTKPVGFGTGLGLYVSYFIITENHKGRMEVISEPEKGTTFKIRLPLKR